MLLMFTLVSLNECSTVHEHGATRGPMKVYQSCCRILCQWKQSQIFQIREGMRVHK